MTNDVRLPILTIERVAPFFWEADAFKVKGSTGLRGCRPFQRKP